jgi:hypothetical protein
MDSGKFNLVIKLIKSEYGLTDSQVSVLTRRLLPDEQEFQRVWQAYQEHMTSGTADGVDAFKALLSELIH